MESFFIIKRDTGQIILEKHWRGALPKNIIDLHYKTHMSANFNSENGNIGINNLSPIHASNQYLFIHILVGEFYFLSVNSMDMPPLMVINFLYRIYEVLKSYIGEVTEYNIKDNFVVVYQVLEEMIDFGFPLVTDTNTLKDIVNPPTVLTKVLSRVTGVSKVHDKMLSGSLSNIPWRKNGITYSNNEIYFDIIEEIDTIIESDGNIISKEINGTILCNSKLSGMPDLNVIFNHTSMEDYSFHPSVRHDNFSNEKSLSFIPPDGNFKLMSYRAGFNGQMVLPLLLKKNIIKKDNWGKFEFTLQPKFLANKTIEDITFCLKLNKEINNLIGHPNIGTFVLDPHSQQMIWKIPMLTTKDKLPSLSGSYTSPNGIELHGVGELNFIITGVAASNLKIESLKVLKETYKPYKGVRSITKAGSYQIRI